METMKAVVKTHPDYGHAELREVPVPKITSDEVLVKIAVASICGSDVHIYKWNDWAAEHVRPPQIMGHELAGDVVEVGKNVKTVKVGDYVSAETHIPCGHCYACRHGHPEVCMNLKILGVDRDGAFTEYIAIPEIVVWENDPSIPKEFASVQEPMGNAVDTVLAEDVAGKSVAILGAGPIGLFAVGVARVSGATTIFTTDLNDYRLKLATKMGANFVLNPSRNDVTAEILEHTHGNGVDVVLEMSGSQKALQQGLQIIAPAGRISLLGVYDNDVTLNLNDGIIFKQIRVYGITGRKIFATWYKVANFLSSRKLDISPLITHRFPLEEFQKGMDLMVEGMSGKILLFPSPKRTKT